MSLNEMIIGNACKNANYKKDFENSKNNFNEMFKLNINHICYVRLKINITVQLILTYKQNKNFVRKV